VSRYLAPLLLVLGIVLSPLRAVAATIPVLIAYDATVRPIATARVEAGPSLRPERGGAPEYAYDDVPDGLDDASNPVLATARIRSTRRRLGHAALR
jgi:hypothetical protein